MANIAWGKPRIFVKDVDDTGTGNDAPAWYELPTPVEGTTALSVSKGEKLEAKVEGGENEDVKYKYSNYTLTYNIRRAKKRQAPFPSTNGLVTNHYAILLQPEDPAVEGFYIEQTTVTVDDTYTPADGAMWQVTMEAVKAASGDTVKWGIVTTTTSNGTTSVSFTESSSNDDYVNGTLVTAATVASSALNAAKNKGGKPADANT